RDDLVTGVQTCALPILFLKVRPALIKLLSDPNPRVRLATAQVFENMGDAARHASVAIVERLGDPNPFVRWVAARTVGRLSNPVRSEGRRVGNEGWQRAN